MDLAHTDCRKCDIVYLVEDPEGVVIGSMEELV
uniref:LYR motif-containing protein At3g19508 n=1 Tax=Rhizophora mucronata TaxID=61149 RepID=A0A2P2IYC1_RHIMU